MERKMESHKEKKNMVTKCMNKLNGLSYLAYV